MRFGQFDQLICTCCRQPFNRYSLINLFTVLPSEREPSFYKGHSARQFMNRLSLYAYHFIIADKVDTAIPERILIYRQGFRDEININFRAYQPEISASACWLALNFRSQNPFPCSLHAKISSRTDRTSSISVFPVSGSTKIGK